MVGLHKTKVVGPRVRIPSAQLKEFIKYSGVVTEWLNVDLRYLFWRVNCSGLQDCLENSSYCERYWDRHLRSPHNFGDEKA